MRQLQVLVATMHQKDFSLAERMNLRCDAVIANQTDTCRVEEAQRPYGTLKMLSTDTAGVGLNRNIALGAADADLLLFADDDVTYFNDMPEQVTRAFAAHPDADVIVFGLDQTKAGAVFRRIRPPEGWLHVWNSMRFGTCVLAARRASLLRCGIHFHTLFGGGCLYSAGEDSLFLKSCFDSGLRVYGHRYVLGTCSKDQSSWFTGCNEKYFYDKGALMACLFPRCSRLMVLRFALIFKRETELSALQRLQWMERGRRGFRTLKPYSGGNA